MREEGEVCDLKEIFDSLTHRISYKTLFFHLRRLSTGRYELDLSPQTRS